MGVPKKLHPEVEQKIREMYFSRKANQAQLAKQFGVSQPTVHRVVSR